MSDNIKVKIYISPEQTIRASVVTGPRGPKGEKGDKGDKGDTGLAFKIAKTYNSVDALLADTSPTGILTGEFALIIIEPVDGIENPDNGKLYLWDGLTYQYTVDMSVQGIQGPPVTEVDGGEF